MTEPCRRNKSGLVGLLPQPSPAVPLVALLLTVLLGLGSFGSQAQTRVTGVVLDADTHEPLSAVTIRIRHSARGTTTGPDGSFGLPIAPQQQQDTLLFSRIGYADLPVALSALNLASPQRLYLHRKPAALDSVAVTARKWVERKFGITSARALIHFTDGTIPAGKPFEIAQLMRVGSQGAVVTSVNLYLAAGTPDSLTITLRFYRLEADRPGRPLPVQPIRQRVATRQGWLRLEVAPYNVYVAQDFVLGLEVEPPVGTHTAVPHEIKLGGKAKSFARAVGESEWRVPPHHYRLYVTARVPDSALANWATDADNLETPASARLYSVAVQDSFSLFVQLPKGYAQHPNRRYPVVFLLDANAYFETVGNELESQHATPSVLIGIGYRDFLQMDSLRQRDYTYPAALAADSLPLAGGGQRFLAFLEQELLSYVDKTYRTDATNRTLMGHSLGGYCTLYAMLEGLKTTAPCFAHYVAASPSLGYGNQYLLRELSALAQPGRQPQQLFLTAGSQELGANSTAGHADKAAFQALVETLAGSKFSAVDVTPHIYPGYSHMETAIPTFIDSQKKSGAPSRARRRQTRP